jgi:hypothetical protein
LQNNSANPVELPQYLSPNYYDVSYEIDGIDFKPWMMADALKPTKVFAANEVIREEIKLFFGSKGWTFKTAGAYKITAKVMGQASNTLTINVVKPNNTQDEAAAKLLLDSNDAGYFLLFEGGEHLTDGMQRLEEIVDNYPNSVLAAYANQALGNNLLVEFTNFATGAYRPINVAKALSYLESVKPQTIGFYNTLHTYTSLYTAYTNQNSTKKAVATLAELKKIISKNYPNFQDIGFSIINNVMQNQANGTISGYVYDKQKNPIANVTLGIQKLGAIASTDANGFFKITGLKAGIYTLKVEKSGYKFPDTPVKISLDKPLVDNVKIVCAICANKNKPFKHNKDKDDKDDDDKEHHRESR